MIGPFQGEYRFLSNFWQAPVTYEGITYPSSEHAYQAAKTLDMELRRHVATLPTSADAKKFGRKIRPEDFRGDWEAVKESVMLEILRLKFQHEDLRAKLLATGTEELVEVNTWGDVTWGVCDGVGENKLGKLLMQVREDVREPEVTWSDEIAEEDSWSLFVSRMAVELLTENVEVPAQRVFHGDCLEVMRALPSASYDAVVSDVPYGLGTREPKLDEILAYLNGEELDTGGDFMGKKWSVPSVKVWREVYRVLKPGAHLAVFGGTRTFDLISLGLRAAGFENRDTISDEGTLRWVQGQGFPHSLDPGRQIDMDKCTLTGRHYDKTLPKKDKAQVGDHLCPAHPDGDPHRGEGTALKSSWEPILLFRKPLEDTVARTVLENGTGILQIDKCRIDVEENDPNAKWPANVVMDEEIAAVMDEDVGVRAIGHWPASRKKGGISTNGHAGQEGLDERYLPGKKASKVFFKYVSKASRSEREAGCEKLPPWTGAKAVNREEESAGLRSPRAGAGRTAKEVRNHHVSVKPLGLMRWILRLVTPPGGRVLDPYVGSGTTVAAGALEGILVDGIERDPEYVQISLARIAHWARVARSTP